MTKKTVTIDGDRPQFKPMTKKQFEALKKKSTDKKKKSK